MAGRILVVDDNAHVRELTGSALRNWGYEPVFASDGFEALLVIVEAPPDLVISDLHMPGMSGFELLSVLRRKNPEIPVICVSGAYVVLTPPPHIVCDAFLDKGGIELTNLQATIAKLLGEPHRAPIAKLPQAVVWLPRGKDGYYIVTCTNCLRSSPVRATTEVPHAEQNTPCPHCDTVLHYFVEGREAWA